MIKTNKMVSSSISVINLPLKKANICMNAAVFVGGFDLKTHFLFVTNANKTEKIQAKTFAINSFMPKYTLKNAYAEILTVTVPQPNNVYKANSFILFFLIFSPFNVKS